MDYKLVQKADRELIYYGIYNTLVESIDEGDILSKIRQKYFETQKRQKNRSTYNIMGNVYRCSYHMENGRPLKWKKMIGSQLAEYSVTDGDGYYVVSLDKERNTYKKTYYDNSHKLLKAEFFSKKNKTVPICTVIPSSDGERSVLVSKNNSVTDVLYPFEQVVDKVYTEELNHALGEPNIFCRTNSGNYYFCNEPDAKKREIMLDKIFENENYADTSGEPDEDIEPAFNIDNTLLNEEQSEYKDNFAENSNSLSEDNDTNSEDKKLFDENVKNENTSVTESVESYVYDKVVTGEQNQPCAFSTECPYEAKEKLIIESGESKYYYYGDVAGDKRNGMGRTAMSDGKTAYEGGYKDDKRQGFGVYYFKSGKLCYAGTWNQNKREGVGVSFSPNDGSVFAGKWQDNKSCGIGACFDKNGELLYLGKTKDGKLNGAGVTYSADGDNFFVGKYKDGQFLGTGTQFDSEGNMMYVGEYEGNVRIGRGISYKDDGSVCYRGEWKNNLYNGKGTLYLENGTVLRGTFKNGKAEGQCSLTDRTGRLIYMGGFGENMYNGAGRLFFDGGAYVEGRFADGEPTGVFNEYDVNNHLVYCGEWRNMRRNGKGIEYKDGVKIYDGSFVNSAYDGAGKLYNNGKLIYSGEFKKGERCGIGTGYRDDEAEYFGMWENNCYNGCGLLYDNGTVKYVGQFRSGKRNGRINEIFNERVIRKCIYVDDVLTYMCEYSQDNIMTFFGNIADGKKNGMGCSYNDECEKEFEGIFRNGMPEKAMQVFFMQPSDLPVCEPLNGSEYEKYRHTPEYAVDKDYMHGKYTGCLSEGMPDGKGTLLFCDHRYTGVFSKGYAVGTGMIYMNDGMEIKGEFFAEPVEGSKTLKFTDMTYYVITE